MGQEFEIDCDSSSPPEAGNITSDSENSNKTPDAQELFSNFQERVFTTLSAVTAQQNQEKYKTFLLFLENFAFYKLCHAIFIDMKWTPTLYQEFTVSEFMGQNKLLTSLKKLIITLLRRLTEREILEEIVEGKTFKVLNLPPSPAVIQHEIKNFRKNSLEYPDFAQDFIFVDYAGSNLLDVITGKESALKILFPSENNSIRYPSGIKRFYEKSNIMKLNKVISTITGFQEYLNSLNMNNNYKEPIRILEIGAGTGGTTIPLLKSLPQEIFDKLTYTFTDISNYFVGQTKSSIESQFSEEIVHSIEFTTLDIEIDPKEQGFELGTYDIVLAADVFHATEFLDDVLDYTRSLMKPNGLLCLGEIFQSTLSTEITFGMTSGWWRFMDKNRTHTVPLLTTTEWGTLLKAHGFIDSFAVGDGIYGVIFALASNDEKYF